MEKEDGRKLSATALEERRKTIVRMWRAGKSVAEIREATSASYDTVYRIWNKWKEAGDKSFRVKPRGNKPGQGRHLSPEQEAKLQKSIVDKCPDQRKLDFALWTREAVLQLIKQEYGMQMPIRTVGEYLKRWGFTPQRPTKFAYERDSRKVEQWLEDTYPEISNRAKTERADIYWGDETRLRASDVRGRGFAPKGQTPIIQATAAYQNLSMVSAITNKGKVHWMIVDGAVNSERFIEFLQRLVRQARRKVFLVLDNLKVHHSKPVKEWVEKHKNKIELLYFPSYSPDLNPDEHLNADLKYGVGSKAPGRTKAHLRKAAEDHMNIIKSSPQRVVKYFEDPAISYAAV